jgi:hypothetical protein
VNEHDFCRCLLQITRADARKERVRVPPLVVDSCGAFGNCEPYHYVRERDTGHVLWEGSACCKWHARAMTVSKLTDEPNGGDEQ